MKFGTDLTLFLLVFLNPLHAQESTMVFSSSRPGASQAGHPASYELALKYWSSPKETNPWVCADFLCNLAQTISFLENPMEGEKGNSFPSPSRSNTPR